MSTIIKLNGEFEIRADQYSWNLIQYLPVDTNHHKSKGDKTTKEYKTYHASVEQCCREALNRTGKEGIDTASKLIEAWNKAAGQISQARQS